MHVKPDQPDWPSLLRPLADASIALGRLALALERTSLHQAWLWRETARSSAKICQIAGHRVQLDRLMQSLAGIPLEPAGDDAGLAAAKRVFLDAIPLFRASREADSKSPQPSLFEPLWTESRGEDGEGLADDGAADHRASGQGRGAEARDRLLALASDLARSAGVSARPALLDLLFGLRRHALARRLPPSLARLALPLALRQTGLTPKAAPALLAGRLPLGVTRAFADIEAITPWLARALDALAEEASAAVRRLGELESQHRAWRDRLAGAGLRRHARAPNMLDLLAATPALSASLAARHLGCSPQAAGAMLRHLANLGIVASATSRARWKIYLAGDLAAPDRAPGDEPPPLAFSDPVPELDREAIDATLDRLFEDLDHLERRTGAALAVSIAPDG